MKMKNIFGNGAGSRNVEELKITQLMKVTKFRDQSLAGIALAEYPGNIYKNFADLTKNLVDMS